MAAEKLVEKYPGLKIAGTHDGYFKEDAPVVEAIAASGADCVFVCLGAPKQEFWIKKNGPATGAHLLCGLGGSLDGVVAGDVNGDVARSVNGVIRGDLNGSVGGDLNGKVMGDLNGDVAGKLRGKVYGGIYGTVNRG
jgi:hypothetical protein